MTTNETHTLVELGRQWLAQQDQQHATLKRIADALEGDTEFDPGDCPEGIVDGHVLQGLAARCQELESILGAILLAGPVTVPREKVSQVVDKQVRVEMEEDETGYRISATIE